MDTESALSNWLASRRNSVANGLIKIPCSLYRGATSKGPIFMAHDLPADEELRNAVIIAALNPDHPGQIDGIGGHETLSNKVIILSPSKRENTDLDYEFLQLFPKSTATFNHGNSVNMGTAIGPYAVDHNLVQSSNGKTEVRVYAVNSDMNFSIVVATKNGATVYAGDAVSQGIAGTSSGVQLMYRPPFGNLTGKTFPTGRRTDLIDAVPVTVVDAGGSLNIIVSANSFGRSGSESKSDIDADSELVARIEPIRQAAAALAGLHDVSGPSPGVMMIGPAKKNGNLAGRKLATFAETPAICHAAFSGSGAIGLAVASVLDGTVASQSADLNPVDGRGQFEIEHPSGSMTLQIHMGLADSDSLIESISITRTSRRLFSGDVYVSLEAIDRVLKSS